MSKRQKHSLKTFVHKTLIVRLVLSGVVISLVLGLAVLFSERDKISESVIALALQRTRLFNESVSYMFDVPGLPDHEKIQREADKFRSGRAKLKVGSFVFILLYNTDLKTVAEVIDRSYAGIEAVGKLVDSSERRVPDHGTYEWHEIVRINGVQNLRIVVPLVSTDGAVVGIVEGVFAPSDETIQGVRRKAIVTMFIVVAIVLLTTALLYPVIINLSNRLTDF